MLRSWAFLSPAIYIAIQQIAGDSAWFHLAVSGLKMQPLSGFRIVE